MPTGLAFKDGALYVIAVDKLIRYDNAEANLDKLGDGKVVYDDMPSYAAHGWREIAVDKEGWFYLPFGPPFNIGVPPTSVSQIRRVDPKTGNAEIYGARRPQLGRRRRRSAHRKILVHRERPRLDQRRFAERQAQHDLQDRRAFWLSLLPSGQSPEDTKFAMGHKCSEFTPPVVNLGAHVAPLGMKFYTGSQFPPEYKNNILIAEHGSWNRHKYQGARIKRVIVGPDGKNAKQEVFASGWLEGDQGYLGRPERHPARQGRLDPRR